MPQQTLASATLHGKVALVTGGTSGIGRATALGFARENARVVIAGRNAERGRDIVRAIRSFGGDCLFVQTDVCCTYSIRELVRNTISNFGRLDYAFNNAGGVTGEAHRLADCTEDQFEQEVNLHLRSVWACMKYEIEQMVLQEPTGGVIVNNSSVSALGGAPLAALYSASKAGVIALTKSAAQEYAKEGIRINAVVASAIETPMFDAAVAARSNGDKAVARSLRQHYASAVPSQRLGMPEDVASVVVWLCTTSAAYINGHALVIDGGLTAWAR